MKTFEELWELLTTQDESNQIEVKRGSEVGKSCKETICAFANEPGLNGGYLILGITDPKRSDSGEYEITGVNDPDKIQQTLASICNDETFNYRFRPEISVETIDGKNVVIAYIPEAPTNQKPIYLKKEGLLKGAFRRIGPLDQRCNDEDLELFYRERQNQSYDLTPFKEADLDDLDPQAIKAYRNLREKANPNATELNFNDRDLLWSIQAIARHPDKEKSDCPTVAGLLLFGTTLALRRYFPMHRIDYIVIEGSEWVGNVDERYQSVIEIREALLLAIPKLSNIVINDLPKGFYLPENELQRQDIPIIPSKVIREAIVNAVMHRNYRKSSPIQIIRYNNRLEMRNVGYSLKPVSTLEEINEPGSVTRNEAIATILHELNLAENKGTGGRTMIELMLEANLTFPRFDSNREQDTFCLTLWTHHLIGEEETQWLAQFKDFNLSNEEARILIVLKEVGHLNNEIYRVANDVDTLTASKALKKLKQKGILESHGKGTATYYALSSEFSLSGELTDPNLESKTDSPSLSGELADLNLESSTLNSGISDSQESPNLESSTKSQKISLPDPVQLSLSFPSDGLPQDLQKRLNKLKKRGQTEEVTELILKLCRWRPLSSQQLAKYLKRSQKYLLDDYLKPMIVKGLLTYTNPDFPNDPHQTYQAQATDK